MIRIYIDNKSIFLADKGSIYSNNAVAVRSYEELVSLYQNFLKAGDFSVTVTADDFSVLRDWFFSMFTIIPAAGGLVKANEQYLFIFRRNTWDLPKGKIDKGESIEQAALREVEEECGVTDLQLEEELCTTYHIYEHKGKTILKPTYWFIMTASVCSLIPQLEEDITKAEWRFAYQLSDIVENTFPSILDVLETADLITR